jgi:hypothetical protein
MAASSSPRPRRGVFRAPSTIGPSRPECTRQGRSRLLITAAVLAITGLLLPAAQMASAGTAARSAAGSGPRPSIVLVHGAWADSSS